MKKSLILSVAAIAATIGMKAEVYTFDFKTNPAWSAEFALENSEVSFIKSDDCTSLNLETGHNGKEMYNNNNVIDLEDGICVDASEANLNHVLIVHTSEYPSRVHLFKATGKLDENYGPASEEDAGASPWGIGFLRPKFPAANGSRANTFLQFPTVNGPCKVTMWLGNQGGKYSATTVAKFVPVVNGVEGEAVKIGGEEDKTYTAKRSYKFVHNYTGEGPVNFRIGCDGEELLVYHVEIETLGNGSGIEDIIANPVDENAPVYNVMGIQVDENYKGIVIKNGKKYIQK